MFSEQPMFQRGIRILFIALFAVVALTADAKSSPIDIDIKAPRTAIDPLNLLFHTYHGSGVVINKDTVLTAFHNIEWPDEGCGTWATGVKVFAYTPEKDICVIEYPTEGQKFSRLAPEPPKVGDRVILIGRFGHYTGTWSENPHYDDQMSVKFDGKRPRIGDSGAGVYSDTGLVGIFLGFSGWMDAPKGEHSRIATWTTLKAFGIPISDKSAGVKPNTQELTPLPGTEDVKAPPQGGITTPKEEPTKESGKEEEINVTRPTTGRSTEADNDDSHAGTPDREPERRRGSGLDDRGQGRGPSDEQGRNLETGTASEPHAGKGASLPPSAPKEGRGSLMEILISALLGAAGITATGGTGIAIYYGVRGLAAIYRRRRHPRSLKQDLEEVLGRSAPSFPHIPGREVDEIGELLQLAGLEGFDPLMGSAFGLFAQDEITRILNHGTEEEKAAIRKLRDRVTDRIHAVAPLVRGK